MICHPERSNGFASANTLRSRRTPISATLLLRNFSSGNAPASAPTVHSGKADSDPSTPPEHSQANVPASAQNDKTNLVPEMPYTGENHRQIQPVGSLDDLLVPHRPSRLNDRRSADFCNLFHAVGK